MRISQGGVKAPEWALYCHSAAPPLSFHAIPSNAKSSSLSRGFCAPSSERGAMLECARGGRGGWMNWAPVVRPSVRRPPSSPTGNRFGILVSLRERQQPVGHRCAVVATAAADRRLLFPRERARVTASPPPHFKRQCMTVAPTTRWGSLRRCRIKARNLGGKSRRRPLSCDTSEGKVSQARNVSK